MVTIRSTLYFVTMVLSVVFFGLAMVTVGMLMPLSARDNLSKAWGATNLWLMRLICGLKYEIKGAENLPQQAAVVMAKHQSSWETMALKAIPRKEQSWILKQELMKVPVFGWALRSVPTIAIDRSAGRKAVKQIVEQGKKLLDDGRIIVVFPEGTRTAPGTRKKYGIGGAILAEKSGYPVVPIAHNSGIFWSRRALKKYPGTIQVIVGEPISVSDKSAAEITRQVETWIETEVDKMPSNP